MTVSPSATPIARPVSSDSASDAGTAKAQPVAISKLATSCLRLRSIRISTFAELRLNVTMDSA